MKCFLNKGNGIFIFLTISMQSVKLVTILLLHGYFTLTWQADQRRYKDKLLAFKQKIWIAIKWILWIFTKHIMVGHLFQKYPFNEEKNFKYLDPK